MRKTRALILLLIAALSCTMAQAMGEWLFAGGEGEAAAALECRGSGAPRQALLTKGPGVLEHVRACGAHNAENLEGAIFPSSPSSGGARPSAAPRVSRQTILHQNIVERK